MNDRQLESLFTEHHDALLRYLIRYTGDRDQAADAVQEAFLRLVQQPPASSANLRAWLFTVATNVVRDGWKREQHARRLAERPDLAPSATPAPDPAAAVERDERQAAVRRMLAKLSETERVVLLMREEGFRHREIADAVGTTTKSVGTMIARALRKLAAQATPTTEALR